MASTTAHPDLAIVHHEDTTLHLMEWNRDSYIAVSVLLLILTYLILRFALAWPASTLTTRAPLLIALLCGLPLIYDLLRNVSKLEFGSDLIAGVSIVSAALMQQYLVAAVVILMLSGGQALEQYALRRAASVLRALAQRSPTVAHVVHDAGYRDIVVDEVKPGYELLVLPHEVCPVDGEVLEGYSRMDESFLTGEPFEISKAPGANVISGAVNGQSMLKIRATRVAQDSRYARILRVVKETEQNQPKMRRIADRLGGFYTPLALVIAGFGWALSGNPERFLAVTVIATPCPLLLAIPIAILGGISLSARRGIVIRNATVLEQIDQCRVFIFDKTGTLTYGRPELAEVLCRPGYKEDEVIAFAASLEHYSRHPLARAVVKAADDRQIAVSPPAKISEVPGDGLRGTVEGRQIHITGRNKAERIYGPLPGLPPAVAGLECLVFIDGQLGAVLRFQDEPKPESTPFVKHLPSKHQAKKVVLLSGDKESEVQRLASLVGIRETYFNQSPEEKLSFVRNETAREKTLFVGDGINDAPSMLAATVGVALGGSSAAISESADAVVLDSSLRKIDELLHIGRRMRRIAAQSAVGGIALSGAGMLLAAFGYLNPLSGAIAQEVIDLASVLNALRVAVRRKALADF
ncbi:MAG TPA: heavy metal translocating P-type ATPase [Candidatus Angelobacter sp.]|jgi:heavy metal translocating P-type ATPase|nr:heavy metal translocating P-type ATPase [Candidatus Angelobacter sp.]